MIHYALICDKGHDFQSWFPDSAAFDKQAKRAKAGISGRVGLKREVEEARAKSTAEDLEMVFVIAIDVAGADGSIGDKEMKALRDLGTSLGGLSPDRYLN